MNVPGNVQRSVLHCVALVIERDLVSLRDWLYSLRQISVETLGGSAEDEFDTTGAVAGEEQKDGNESGRGKGAV